jgi:hypothetical protein
MKVGTAFPAVLFLLFSGCSLFKVGTDSPADVNVDIPVFPADNPWNTDISGYPVHANSTDYIDTIGSSGGLHPDFGTVWEGAPNGIPFIVVGKGQPKVRIDFVDWPEESDPGPYPIPNNAPIEGGADSTGDRHVIVIDRDARLLYELGNARKGSDRWTASCGAIWDLNSNALRPEGWTSVDAAGLPIFPGLARYDEAASGEIKHALRFTVNQTFRGYIHPATHYASDITDADYPPMGLRLRLKGSFDLSSFSATNRAILAALKKYGMIVADNGSDWYISGAPDPRWNDEDLAELSAVKGSDFEVVETGPVRP